MTATTSRNRGSVRDDRTAMTEDAAIRLSVLSRPQLRYWSETGVLRPSIVEQLGPRSVVRLYSFPDLVALLVAAALRGQFSLQHVRRIVEHLREQGYERPLAELRFAIDGNQFYLQHPDGSWEGGARPGQVVLSHVVEFEPLRVRIRESANGARPATLRGTLERKRSRLGSKPVFAGTRTPVAALHPHFERRYSAARIIEAFPIGRVDELASPRTSPSTRTGVRCHNVGALLTLGAHSEVRHFPAADRTRPPGGWLGSSWREVPCCPRSVRPRLGCRLSSPCSTWRP